MRKIEVRSHSKAELIQKLQLKFPNERGMILKVIEEMERVQLLNDRRFTEEYINHLIQKPIGRLKIMVESRKKGLDEDLVEQVLLEANWTEEESAKKALEEKQRVLSDDDPRKKKEKLINFLKNRGFTDKVIWQVTK